MARAVSSRAWVRAGLWFIGGVAFGVVGSARANNPYAGLDLFARVLTQIRNSYVDPVSQEALVYRALDGMDAALDPHSSFMDPGVWKRIRAHSSGEYVGIGANTVSDSCGLRITTTARGGPSDRAGILPEDCIVAVDGIAVAGLSTDDASARVQGKEGEAVLLTIARAGTERRVAVLRARVVEAAVESVLMPSGLAYLRVASFRERVSEELVVGVRGLGAVRGAVLDLRGNPGGRIDQAIAVVDLFVSSGRIVSTRGRSDGEHTYEAHADPTDWTWPLVVVIDGSSASAAEIVAGALRDAGRATIVGARSYGKGSVQSVFEYEDGSALKLTIARYYLPKGEPIGDRTGITPDIEVALANPPSVAGSLPERIAADAQLAAAINELRRIVVK